MSQINRTFKEQRKLMRGGNSTQHGGAGSLLRKQCDLAGTIGSGEQTAFEAFALVCDAARPARANQTAMQAAEVLL